MNNSNVIPAKAGIQIKSIAFLSGFPGQAREWHVKYQLFTSRSRVSRGARLVNMRVIHDNSSKPRGVELTIDLPTDEGERLKAAVQAGEITYKDKRVKLV